MKTCKIENCSRSAETRDRGKAGMCQAHYMEGYRAQKKAAQAEAEEALQAQADGDDFRYEDADHGKGGGTGNQPGGDNPGGEGGGEGGSTGNQPGEGNGGEGR